MIRISAFSLCALALTAAVLPAQNKQAVVPKAYEAGGDDRTLVPLSEQPMRYQQSITGAKILEQIKGPVRLRGISFRTKGAGMTTGVQIEVDVVISSFVGGTLSGIFSRNLQSDATLVVPKQKINLPRPSTGGWDLNLAFSRDWTWDGKSDLVFDIRVYSNGNQNRQFFYWWDSIAPRRDTGVNAHFALGANASRSTTALNGRGLVMRLDYQDGAVLKYGKGCRGQGGFIPEISPLGLPTVGNQGFRVNLQKARPSTGAVMLWGGSDSQWGPLKLPFDTVAIGVPNCQLLAEPLALIGARTVGGSPGAGIASAAFPIPPSGLFVGVNLYMQWMVIDNSNNAALDLVFSDAMRVIIGG